MDVEAAMQRITAARAEGRRIGFTCGVFDLLHEGHVLYLEEARRRCDFLVVGLNSDRSTTTLKGPDRPIAPFAARRLVLLALRAVDLVVELDDDRPLRLIEAIRPDFYFKGGDYKDRVLRSAATVESLGGRVETIDVGRSISTTELILTAGLSRLLHRADLPLPEPAKGLLVDRDGTLIESRIHPAEADEVVPLPGAMEALAAFTAAGYRIAIITNQQGIGLGLFTWSDYRRVSARLLQLAGEAGARIDRIYTCPHVLGRNCGCRKPADGLFRLAIEELGLRREGSLAVGDRETDLLPARRLGIETRRIGDVDWNGIRREYLG